MSLLLFFFGGGAEPDPGEEDLSTGVLTTTIIALARGGYSVHGKATYDAREDEVVFFTEDPGDEQRAVTAQFPESISSVTQLNRRGIRVGTPVLSTATATISFFSIQEFGYIEYLVTLASGEKRFLRIVAKRIMPRFEAPTDYGTRSRALRRMN